MRRILGALFVFALLVVLAQAQTFRGAINGTVSDQTGAMVGGASVRAIEVATGAVHTMDSTTEGQFAFQDLPLGGYKIVVSAKGFREMTVENVVVTAGQIYTLPIKLSVGQESTAIEVSANAVAVDTTTVTQSNTIPSEAVQDVPLNGRDFTQLITTAPGYGGYAVGGFGSLNGTRANQMNWQIDGTDNNDFWHNIPAVNQGGVSGIAGIVLPIDAVDEFSAQTQSNAESGRNAGGTINLAIKSGGNALHGSAYYYNRNEFYGAASPFLPVGTKKPPLRNENWGGSVSGPILKDRTFFFLGFEKQKYTIGLSGLATEPSIAWQNQALAVLDNAGNQFGNYAPVAHSPLSKTLISTLWPSLIDGLPGTTNNFFSPVASFGYSYNGIVKLDHNFTTNHHLSARWFVGQGSQTAPLGGSPALATASSNLADYFEVAPLHVQNYSLILNSVLSSRMTNQLLFGVNYFHQNFHDANNSFDTKALGLFLSPDALIDGKPIKGAPQIAISGFEQIGISAPTGRNDATGHLTDNFSYTVGKHQYRFGGEVRQGRVEEFYFRHSIGNFIFDGTVGDPTQNGAWASTNPAVCNTACQGLDINTKALADFLAGNIARSSISVGNAERHVQVNAFDFFFQDSWQVTRRLNLNYGARYEYFGPLHSQNDAKDLAVFIPSKGGLVIQGAGIDNIFPPDRNNFAPRFGFAYQPKETGSLVVRGGIGVFFDQINMNPFLDYRPPNGGADGLESNPGGPSTVSNYTTNRLGQVSYNWDAVQAGGNSVFNPVTTCLTGNVATDPNCGTSTFGMYSVNQNYRTPYFYNWNLNVEKGFGNAGVLQVGYVGSAGHKLSVMLDINQHGQFATQFPNVSSINQLNSIGNSNYNSLQTTYKLRTWHGLTSQVSYTWAHALDMVTEYRGVFPLDSDNLKAEYGNGDFDTRHNFTTYFTYDVPGSSHGPKILTHGWQVSSLMTFHSGQPFNITGGFNRPGMDLIGDPFAGVSHAFSKSGVQWVNPAVFVPASTPLGNLRRNRFYGPGYDSVDLSVFKNIPIRERFKMQLRAEMFNLLNHNNLASGGGSVGSDGRVTDTIGDFNGAPGLGPGEAFNMQLALKLIF
jgi:hypothetical protein